jgi:hypothetical protein
MAGEARLPGSGSVRTALSIFLSLPALDQVRLGSDSRKRGGRVKQSYPVHDTADGLGRPVVEPGGSFHNRTEDGYVPILSDGRAISLLKSAA